MDNKPTFIKFLKKRYGMWSLWMPLWLTIIIVSFANSAKLLNAGYSFTEFLFDAVGGIIFVTILTFIYFLLFDKRKLSKTLPK